MAVINIFYTMFLKSRITIIIDYTKVEHTYIVGGKIDMRCGIGEASVVMNQMNQYELDVYSDDLFLFCGGHPDRFKALYLASDDFLLVI
jgi:transposase